MWQAMPALQTTQIGGYDLTYRTVPALSIGSALAASCSHGAILTCSAKRERQVMNRRIIIMAIVGAAIGVSVTPATAAEVVLSDGQVVSTGRVVQVDMDGRKITIEHKPINHFYMESMTMTFRVKDSTALTTLTPGDKIRFEVERGNDGFIITKIDNAN